MNNSDMPAMPIVVPASEKPEFYAQGLSKREHFAAMAMQGLMANDSSHIKFYKDDAVTLATYAVANADALLKALEE